MNRRNLIDVGVRNAGALYHPGGAVDISTEQVISARGLGRWVYCKYCYKNVLPAWSIPNASVRAAIGPTRQVICSECGAGLAPFEQL